MDDLLVIDPYDADGTRFIRVAGEIDAASAPLLAEALEQCNGSPVCVDLANVTFMDSSGVAVLVAAHKRAAEHNLELTIANAAPHMLKVLEIANLDHLLNREPI